MPRREESKTIVNNIIHEGNETKKSLFLKNRSKSGDISNEEISVMVDSSEHSMSNEKI